MSQRVQRLQKPKAGPLDPQTDPILAHFVGILSQIGVEKVHFFENFVFALNDMFWVPRGSGILKKTKIGAVDPTQWTPFWPRRSPPVAAQFASSRT